MRGLQRFVGPAPERAPDAAAAAEPAAHTRCEMCTTAVPDEHSHVVDVEQRRLLCTCRPCYMLFVPEGASMGRYRAVGDRELHDPAFAITGQQWGALGIPVGMAFVFRSQGTEERPASSRADATTGGREKQSRYVAFYPSPAGATESLLPEQAWEEVAAANPGLAAMEPDVEALLLRRERAADAGPDGDGSQDRFEGFLVPIDRCYELVGLVRLHWKGFDGGEEAWARLDAFFAGLRERSRPLPAHARS